MLDLSQAKVLVTPRSFGLHDSSLHEELSSRVGEVVYNSARRPLTSEQLGSLLRGCDGYIAGVDEIDRKALESSSRLKVVSRYGVGVENVDLAAAAELGIVVTNTPAANAGSVAELAIGLILSLLRNIPHSTSETRIGNWPRVGGVSLEGKTVGVIGLGSIGKQLVVRLQGFGCRVVAYDLFPDEAFASRHDAKLVSFAEALRESDIVSLHLPLTAETVGLFNSDAFEAMKPGAFFINTSRGGLINEDALLNVLVSGHLSGAALDVLSSEPPPDHPLLTAPNILITPHAGAHTDGATNAMGWGALNDCLAVLGGDEPQNRVL